MKYKTDDYVRVCNERIFFHNFYGRVLERVTENKYKIAISFDAHIVKVIEVSDNDLVYCGHIGNLKL